jgi:TRAP-type transport system periplasmic protein
MKKVFWMVALAFTLGFAGLTSSPPVDAQEKAISLNFADFFPPQQAVAVLMGDWCKEVEKRTSGRVKVTHFPGGILTPPAQVYASVIKGVADIGISFTAYTKGRFPMTDLFTYPMGCKNGYVGTKLIQEYYNKFKPKEFDEVKVMYLINSPPTIIGTKKPIKTLEDLKGLKIRSAGPVESAVVMALGAVPVALPSPDIYDGIQKGAVAGFLGNPEIMVGFKVGEVISHTVEPVASMGAGYIVMNKNKWNTIAPNDQKTIEDINTEYLEKISKLWLVIVDDGYKFFTDKGGKRYILPAEENARWLQKLLAVTRTYVKELNAQGLPGDELFRFATEYLQSH